MHADVAGSLGNQQVIVDPVAMQIIGKEGSPVFFGPVVSQVDHGTAVSMAAASHRVMVGRVTGIGPGTATPVQVVGNRLDPLIDVGILLFGGPPFTSHPGNNMPEMGQHRVGGDQVPILVKISTPRIDHSASQFLELVIDRMKPPHATRDLCPFGFGRPRLTNLGQLVKADGPVKPAIRSPMKIINDVIRRFLKTVEHRNRLPVRNIVPI